MKHFSALMLAVTMCSFSGETISAELQYAITGDNRLFIELEGEIISGDSAKLARFIRSDLYSFNYAKGLILNSRGGSLTEAIKIGRIVEETGLRVDVPKESICASACFFIYVSAPVRLSEGELIVHRPYFDMSNAHGDQRDVHDAAYREAISQARDYLSARSVPSDIIDMMMTKSSSQGYALTTGDVIRVDFFSPSVDEYQIQRCGRRSDRIMTKDEISLLNQCSDDYLSATKMRYMFGKDADVASNAFLQLQSLAEHYRATDPEFQFKSNEYSSELRSIVNASPPPSWVGLAKKSYRDIKGK